MKKRILSFLLVLCLFCSTFLISASAATSTPADISGDTYAESIQGIMDLGGLTGLLDSNGNFKPTEPCTQADFATILKNLYPTRSITQSSWFTSTVATQSWATNVLQQVSSTLGYRVTWSDGSPTATIVRGQACFFICEMWKCEPRLRNLVGSSGNTNANGVQPNPSPITYPEWSANAVGGFTDVHWNDYFCWPVFWALQKGITGGTSASTFSPNDQCSITIFLTMLWRSQGSPSPNRSTVCPYSNVSTTSEAYNVLRWAKEKNLLTKEQDTIDPATTACTRAYAVWAMWKLAGSNYVSSSYGNNYTDVPSDASYVSAVRWAAKEKVALGTSSTTFEPLTPINRAMAVTLLYNAYGN